MSLMTFREYKDFNREASKTQYQRNVSYYDPTQGWVLDLNHKIINSDDGTQTEENP